MQSVRWPGTSGQYSSRKWTNITRPHCFVLLTETPDDPQFATVSCFRYEFILREAATNPAYKRHYGGQSPLTNGSNFLFADGHVTWHSADFAASKLICCADLGKNDAAGDNASAARALQASNCGGGRTPRGNQRR